MKKIKVILMLVIAAACSEAQVPGEWTWMNSDSTMNFTGSYGTKGIPSPTNKPPAVYEATEWTDSQNNFWFYGGQNEGIWYNDLWKYNVSTNEWTWIKGSGGLPNKKPVYGTAGIASKANSPGERVESQSWIDNQDNLWLFGGVSYIATNSGGSYNDLWKYNIATNMWTWMRGDTTTISGGCYGGYYGIKGIENSLNNPPHLEERDITWADDNDNLWMLDEKGCLWKYRISTNNWIWIKGDTTGITVYGQKGIASLNTTPGSDYFAYTRWKDSANNFWLLYTDYRSLKVIFKYDLNTNMWTWVWGDTIILFNNNSDSHYGDSLCDYEFLNEESENVIPFSRGEARACWIDACDNLWLMGGFGYDHSIFGDLNDLIYFDTSILKWIWAGNDTTHNYTSSYGTMGVSSPLNKPAARSGAIPFKDATGNLWLYGGVRVEGYLTDQYGDLWKFSMDHGCSPCVNPSAVIPEIASDDKITIYPNPSTDQLTVHSPVGATTLQIVNTLGQIVFSEEINSGKTQIDVHSFSSGMYWVIMKSDAGVFEEMFLKQ